MFGGSPAPDPNRTRQEFTLTAAMLGGYDDNLAATIEGSGAEGRLLEELLVSVAALAAGLDPIADEIADQ